jgi:general secretion pathway protein J
VRRTAPRPGPRGFTLLELTVALAIFAVLSTMAYGGLRQVLEARRQTEQVADRLTALQLAVRQIELDLEQAAPRPIRDERGAPRAALVSTADGDFVVELTTASWRNPAGLHRSTLRRVAYRVKNGVLIRYAWSVLDRSPDSQAVAEALLPETRHVGLRFLDSEQQWHGDWPPLGQGGDGPQDLPIAVEMTLDLADWGTIQRLFRLPDARLQPAGELGGPGGPDQPAAAGGAG